MTLPQNSMNNHFRKLALTGVAAACIASSAYADGTYILQLGSFDTKEKAEQKWQELKSKNADILGTLTMNVSEIAMSADDKVSYRTQAGPISSHDDAEKLCSKLLAKGAECYVVETAMFTSDQAPVESAAAPEAKPAENNVVAQVTTEQPHPVKTPEEAEPNPSAGAPNGNIVVAGREPRFLDDDEPAGKPVKAQAPQTPAHNANVAAIEKMPPADTAIPEEKVKKETPAEVSKTSEDFESAPVISDKYQGKKSQNMIVPGRGPRFLDDDSDTKVAAAPVVTASIEKKQEPETVPARQQEEKKPGFFGRLFGSSSNSVKYPTHNNEAKQQNAPDYDNKNIAGNVNVAEAIRVPLTDDNEARSKVLPRIADNQVFEPAGVVSNINYWVQINYFANEEKAHNLYEEFRNTYPDLSDGVRMRITRPYAYSDKPGHVTLRIGTFNKQNDINTVCSLAAKRGLHCTKIKDNGKSGTNNKHENSGNISAGNNAVANNEFLGQPADNNLVYWIQLGTFSSEEDAWDKWKSIKKTKKKIIGKANATVTQPQASSAQRKIFRLRTGPYASQSAAEMLCNKLLKSGGDCIVVSEH